jgi:hypothetical protein
LCHKCLSFSISYWDLIKFSHFADTTERGDRGWKQAQRHSEDRLILLILVTLKSARPMLEFWATILVSSMKQLGRQLRKEGCVSDEFSRVLCWALTKGSRIRILLLHPTSPLQETKVGVESTTQSLPLASDQLDLSKPLHLNNRPP